MGCCDFSAFTFLFAPLLGLSNSAKGVMESSTAVRRTSPERTRKKESSCRGGIQTSKIFQHRVLDSGNSRSIGYIKWDIPPLHMKNEVYIYHVKNV